jgi:GTP-binding protein
MFVDRVRILARAGKGGDGGLSFLRESGKPWGGPDGGNGGRGGSILVQVNPHLNNLVHLQLSPHQFAKNGQNGHANQCDGKGAKNLIIEVPQGTTISRLTPEIFGPDFVQQGSGLLPMPAHGTELELVADLTEKDQSLILCKGGNGGRGNMNFASSVNQAPRRFEPGREGESGQYLFELKSIADIGLVGYPNAGKSTLLSRVSHAHPKIAAYPFTTLVPMVGVIEYPDYSRITMADIPGLIEGAHAGVGLGHEFLRHIERTRLLLFVLDMAGTEGRDPRDDFAQLRTELKLYREDLAKRPFLIVANKCDLPEAAEHLKAFKKRFRYPVYPVKADDSTGLEALKLKLKDILLDT